MKGVGSSLPGGRDSSAACHVSDPISLPLWALPAAPPSTQAWHVLMETVYKSTLYSFLYTTKMEDAQQ